MSKENVASPEIQHFSLGIAKSIRPQIQAIAEAANQIRDQRGPGGEDDMLLNWEVRGDFGTYTIVVTCAYRR